MFFNFFVRFLRLAKTYIFFFIGNHILITREVANMC